MVPSKLAILGFVVQFIFQAYVSAATLLRTVLRPHAQIRSLADVDLNSSYGGTRQRHGEGLDEELQRRFGGNAAENAEEEAGLYLTKVRRRRRRRRRGDGPEVDPEVQKPHDCKCPSQKFVPSDTQLSVLFIGDSLYQGASGSENYIKIILEKHDINASFVENTEQGYCGTSHFWVQCLDAVLQNGNWDAVSYNWGLHDVCPSVYADVSVDDYKATLDLVYSTLKAKLKEDAYIVFHKSTPVGPDDTKRNITSVIAINDALDEIAAEYDPPIPVNDVYQPIVDKCREFDDSTNYPEEDTCPALQQSQDPHFTADGRKMFAKLVAQPILDALNA